MIFATDDIAPVLERTVQWDSLLASRLVTEADVKVIRGYDDQGPLARRVPGAGARRADRRRRSQPDPRVPSTHIGRR